MVLALSKGPESLKNMYKNVLKMLILKTVIGPQNRDSWRENRDHILFTGPILHMSQTSVLAN